MVMFRRRNTPSTVFSSITVIFPLLLLIWKELFAWSFIKVKPPDHVLTPTALQV